MVGLPTLLYAWPRIYACRGVWQTTYIRKKNDSICWCRLECAINLNWILDTCNVSVCYKKRNGFYVLICEQCRTRRFEVALGVMCKHIFVVIVNDCLKVFHILNTLTKRNKYLIVTIVGSCWVINSPALCCRCFSIVHFNYRSSIAPVAMSLPSIASRVKRYHRRVRQYKWLMTQLIPRRTSCAALEIKDININYKSKDATSMMGLVVYCLLLIYGFMSLNILC